jgi:cold shock protein
MSKKGKGRIKWFKEQKGFGFIEIDDGKDIFVHKSQVSERLEPGDVVEFKLKDSKKGPIAVEVKKVG